MKKSAVERALLYRTRATEIRSTAAAVSDTESHAALLRLAEIYERLAAKIEDEDQGEEPESSTG